jgi:small subunit ribosomal protein S17
MATTTQQGNERKPRKMRIGIVTSAHKTPRTIRVEIQQRKPHDKYGKYVRTSSGLLAHDEKEEANPGDRVQVMECRPHSKSKTWRLIKVLERAPQD